DRGCERELAEQLAEPLDAGDLPDIAVLRRLFGPDPARLPTVSVQLASLNGYEALMPTIMDYDLLPNMGRMTPRLLLVGVIASSPAMTAARCTWRGLDHFKSYVWSSVVAYNLVLFARLKPT
ncbi:hypothetical protein NKH56_27095, partial [Mesorhizobium sp. M1076]